MINNLLPEDTRLAEICSAITIFCMGLLISSGRMTTFSYTELYVIQREEFWATIFLIFGFVQLVSLIQYYKFEVLRCFTSLICGCFLIWISLGTTVWDIQLTDIATFVLGFSNLYSFIINSVQIGKKWEK